jgi:hypothetical protein
LFLSQTITANHESRRQRNAARKDSPPLWIWMQ